MTVVTWLVVGAVIGWIASRVLRTDTRQGVILNVVVGMVGAWFGGWLLSPLVGAGAMNHGSLGPPDLLVSFVGAVVLLILVNLVRKVTAQ